MSGQILELSEDVDLIDRLKKQITDRSVNRAWFRVIGTVKNAVFVKMDGGETFVPGVVQLVQADVVLIKTAKTVAAHASATVTRDGKSTVCGSLRAARIVSVFVLDEGQTMGAAERASRAAATDEDGWTSEAAPDGRSGVAESILETEDEASLLKRLTNREPLDETPHESPAEPTQTSFLTDPDDHDRDDASSPESAETKPRRRPSASGWAAVAAASDEVGDRDAGETPGPASASKSGRDGASAWSQVAATSEKVARESSTKPASRSAAARGVVRRGAGAAGSGDGSSPLSPAEKLRAFAESAEDLMDVDELEPGDILEHPIMGQCRVLRVLDDSSAQVKIRHGATRKLMLKIFDIVRVDDHRFELRKPE